MKLSRGEFLTACGSALLGAALEARAANAELFDPGDSRQDIAGDEMRRHVNTAFLVLTPGGGTQRLLLTQVDDHTIDGRIEQFSAVFRGNSDAMLADGTYRFEHPAFAHLDLFIVAVGTPNGSRVCYEACFTRFSGRELGDVLR